MSFKKKNYVEFASRGNKYRRKSSFDRTSLDSDKQIVRSRFRSRNSIPDQPVGFHSNRLSCTNVHTNQWLRAPPLRVLLLTYKRVIPFEHVECSTDHISIPDIALRTRSNEQTARTNCVPFLTFI